MNMFINLGTKGVLYSEVQIVQKWGMSSNVRFQYLKMRNLVEKLQRSHDMF